MKKGKPVFETVADNGTVFRLQEAALTLGNFEVTIVGRPGDDAPTVDGGTWKLPDEKSRVRIEGGSPKLGASRLWEKVKQLEERDRRGPGKER